MAQPQAHVGDGAGSHRRAVDLVRSRQREVLMVAGMAAGIVIGMFGR